MDDIVEVILKLSNETVDKFKDYEMKHGTTQTYLKLMEDILTYAPVAHYKRTDKFLYRYED